MVQVFLEQWMSGAAEFPVQTSGSTGTPKAILLTRHQLEASAKRTLQFFGLQPGDRALLGLPVQTIAGKMMILRALLGELELIITDPDSQPMNCLETDERIDFFPLSPMQLNLLGPEQLKNVNTLLLGGSPLSPALEKRITVQHDACYIGFGMTETVSHIALRKAGDPSYHALKGVTFSTLDGKLIIEDELLQLSGLVTNDLVELTDSTRFKWLGRDDFAINSGGVKIHPEQLEQVLSDVVKGAFFIAGIPDDTFGQKCILLVDTMTEIDDFEQLCTLCRDHFGPYSAPKQLYRLPFIYSSGTKINRRLTLEQLTIQL